MSLAWAIKAMAATAGDEMVLRREDSGATLGVNGKLSGGTDLKNTISGVWEEIDTAEVDGTLLQATDRRLITSAHELTIVPLAGDWVDDGSDVYRVLRVKRLAVSGSDVGYALYVRGS